jgi:hypothetical protein
MAIDGIQQPQMADSPSVPLLRCADNGHSVLHSETLLRHLAMVEAEEVLRLRRMEYAEAMRAELREVEGGEA